eukprot:TRINITY_DN8003_c0_g1_i1.p1 TRINITY_DN8003_c0_g1~~TRINITY_DN8003_c0_g1_i1.p1  ORF type:complete len:251 (+),score=20.32 TRINITY_DN8003_c0_g1_i1:61-813(+)
MEDAEEPRRSMRSSAPAPAPAPLPLPPAPRSPRPQRQRRSFYANLGSDSMGGDPSWSPTPAMKRRRGTPGPSHKAGASRRAVSGRLVAPAAVEPWVPGSGPWEDRPSGAVPLVPTVKLGHGDPLEAEDLTTLLEASAKSHKRSSRDKVTMCPLKMRLSDEQLDASKRILRELEANVELEIRILATQVIMLRERCGDQESPDRPVDSPEGCADAARRAVEELYKVPRHPSPATPVLPDGHARETPTVIHTT